MVEARDKQEVDFASLCLADTSYEDLDMKKEEESTEMMPGLSRGLSFEDDAEMMPGLSRGLSFEDDGENVSVERKAS